MAYALARFGARYLPRLARYAARAVPRLFRKRRPVRRMMRKKKVANRIHKYVRWCEKETLYPTSEGPYLINSVASDQHLVYTFKLDNVINASDFTNLYDAYKITKVILYLERASNDTGDENEKPINKKISVVWDDDGNALSDEDQYLEYANCRRYNMVGNGAIKLVLYPKISTPVLNTGGGVTAFQSISSSKNWLKIENADVPHFGFKIHVPGGTDNASGAANLLFNVRAKFYMSFKNSK